jgi:CTP:molybdopterin cytidylyltransferase MocA
VSVWGLVLAAGAGSRFAAASSGGVPKPLASFRGRPLIERPLAAVTGGGTDRTLVVLGAHAAAVRAGVALGDAGVVVCQDWAEGLSASLRAGVAAAAAGGATAVVVVLGDQPLLEPAAVARLIEAREPAAADALRATYDGVPGHPTLLEASTFGAVAALRGDAGARDLFAGGALRVRRVACDGLGRPDDADTPAALDRLA